MRLPNGRDAGVCPEAALFARATTAPQKLRAHRIELSAAAVSRRNPSSAGETGDRNRQWRQVSAKRLTESLQLRLYRAITPGTQYSTTSMVHRVMTRISLNFE
jgi:hypothetical protein